MVDRMMRASRADVALYEEVEHNKSLTTEAVTVVGIVAVISALGAAVVALATDGSLVSSLIGNFISVIVGFFIWSFLVFFIGTNVFNGEAADVGEILRPLGYAYTPQILSFIPCVGFLAALWSLYLGFVAIRQGLDLDNGKTALTVVISFVVMFVVQLLIAGVFGLAGAGLGAITG